MIRVKQHKCTNCNNTISYKVKINSFIYTLQCESCNNVDVITFILGSK